MTDILADPGVHYHPVTRWDTLIDDFTDWLQLRGLSPLTVGLRRDHLGYIARNAGATPAELTRARLRAIYTGHDWSAEYRRSLRASLVAFYRWATTEGHLPEDISDALPEVKAPQPRPRPATDGIWAQLLARADDRELLMVRLAGEAGLRRAEVAALHSDDLIGDAHGPALRIVGKGGKQRVVPISAALAAALAARPAGYVFPNRRGGHLSARHVGEMISALMPPGWSIHSLRHRFATRGYAGTGNLRAVQEALGHASVATTQRYTAVSSRDVRSVAEAAAAY